MITNKLSMFRVLIFVIFVYSFLSGQEKKTLAVLDLEAIGISPIEAKALTQRLRSELIGTSRFIILERGVMNQILDEMKFQISGCTSSECMVEVGQILGVQSMVGGSVSKVGNLYSIDLRLIDVETSAILSKATKDIEGKIENVMKAGIKAVAIEIAIGRPASVSIPITEVSGEVKTITDIDGNVYNTIVIGTQVWMAENLKVTHYRNGDAIPNVNDAKEWENHATGAYCNYDNKSNNSATYGCLYNWYAINDSRNITPEGWHVPSDADWKILEMYLGMSQSDADDRSWRGTDEGGKLKEAGITHWSSPNTGATNESGFSALPGGFRYVDSDYYDMVNCAYFWSSTESYSADAWFRRLNYDYSGVLRSTDYRECGFSVRCVRD